MDDDRNLSDALADAILRMGYPDLHRGKGRRLDEKPAHPRQKSGVRVKGRHPKPDDLVLPPGVQWHPESRRCVVRVSIARRLKHVCMLPPTQAGADKAGELVQLARRMRDDGHDLASIKRACQAARALMEESV